MNLLLYFVLFLKASLFSTSGTGNVPSLHADLIPRGWATQQEFAESLAVGQVSPGPSGLWVVSLGYLTAGIRGAFLSVIAIVIPPLLVIAIDKVYRRIGHHAAVEGFIRGLGLSVIGIFVVVLLGLLNGVGLSVRSTAIAAAAMVLGSVPRIPVAVILGFAALLGYYWR